MTEAEPTPPAAPESRVVRRATGFALAAGFAGLAFGPRIGLSVLAGSAVTLGNLLLLRRMVGRLGATVSGRVAVATALFTVVRYALLTAVLIAIIAFWNAHPIGVVIGLGAPLLAIVLEVGRAGSRIFGAGAPDSSPAPRPAESAPGRAAPKDAGREDRSAP